jgi:hypothetical protein
MKILFVGDTHGNSAWLDLVIEEAENHNVGWIMQLGDFGYWEHKNSGVMFLAFLQDKLESTNQQLVWLDGNHENHPVLRRTYGPSAEKHQTHSEHGFWRIRNRIWHASRGHRWTWDDVTFLALGGAYSIDQYCSHHRYATSYPKGCPSCRVPGKSWWPQETITEDEMALAKAGGLVDVMVTHDCPDGVQGAIPDHGGLDRQKDRWPESKANRVRLAEVVKFVRPFTLIHGHYHWRNTETWSFPYGDETGELAWWPVLIQGLACDGMPGNCLLIDTKEMSRHG